MTHGGQRKGQVWAAVTSGAGKAWGPAVATLQPGGPSHGAQTARDAAKLAGSLVPSAAASRSDSGSVSCPVVAGGVLTAGRPSSSAPAPAAAPPGSVRAGPPPCGPPRWP